MTQVRIEDLKPSEYNPRKISPLQREKLRKSYEEYGDLSGIILNETTGNLIGGHQRTSLFRNAKGVKIESRPYKDSTGTVAIGHVVIPREGGGTLRIPYRQVRFDGHTEMAANIAANAGGGEFDQVKLGQVLAKLGKSKFDIENIPLDSFEMRQAIRRFESSSNTKAAATDSSAPKPAWDAQLSPAEKDVQRKAWRKLIADWHDITQGAAKREWITTNATKGALAVKFVQALLTGAQIDRFAASAYSPHRIFLPGASFAISDLWPKALKSDAILDSIIWYSGNSTTVDKYLSAGLGMHGHRVPSDFPAHLARDLIEEFCKKDGRVLDPCHGWGGRMLGFLLSRKAGQYLGYDVDKQTHDGVQAMYTDLAPLAMRPKSAKLILQPFEESKIQPGSCDMALTSPPYFDTERYGGKEQSWKRYNKFDVWVTGFYKPMLLRVSKALKPGGTFCLQVGSQSYPLEETAKKLAKECGFKWLESRDAGMANEYSEARYGAEKKNTGEVVMILKKL